MKPFASLATVVDQLVVAPPWDSSELTFSFPAVLSSDHSGNSEVDPSAFSPLTPAQREAVRAALAAYEDVADVTFTEVSGANGNNGDLRFHNLSTLNGAVGEANASYPGPGSGGDVFISPTNINYHDLLTPNIGGGRGFETYMHEIGHAMGLGHAGTYNGGSPTYENDALFVQDTEQYTVMSYFGAQDGGADFIDAEGNLRFPQTLMLYDVAAIQSLYGAAATRTGATVYGFNSTAGGVFDFASNPNPVVCIYDAGGKDVLDFSGYSDPTRIDLRDGHFSDSAAMTRNVSIAFGTVIENGVGGSAADSITGNGARNKLTGRDGNDTLKGGGDSDTLKGGAGNDRLKGNAGADKLKGGADNDRLDGGSGSDTLAGGEGRDRFQFTAAPGDGADLVKGFDAADDVIMLAHSLFKRTGKGDGSALKDKKFHASADGEAHDRSDRILYDTTDGKLYWDRDGSRHTYDPVHFATLKGHPAIDAADFLIV